MSLSEDQFEFLQDVALLIQYAARRGFRLTGGDLYREPDYAARYRSGAKSFHCKRLAIDLNLFWRIDGRWQYMASTEAHRELGEFWKSLNPEQNVWGGDWRDPDGNHYSRGEH